MQTLRRLYLILLAGALSVVVVASSTVSAQEAEEQPSPADAEAIEVVIEEPAPVIGVAMPEQLVAAPAPVLLATPAPVVAATAVPAPAASGNKLSGAVVDNRFQPTALNIAPGTTVTWTNNGNNIHTLTSPDGLFDSGGLVGGASFSFTFDSAGTFRLICRQHGLNGMAGQVVVQ